MEAIRYAVIHAESGVYQSAFDTLKEADREAADLNSIYGDGIFVSRAIDKREAELKEASIYQLLAREAHWRAVDHMVAAAEWGDAWPRDRDRHLENARMHQRVHAVCARRAMEAMGVIDPD